jgi:hypothetical protein
MPRWAATLLGLLTALPIGYVDWHLAAMALSSVLLMIYLIATFTLRQVPKSKRMFWAIAHLLFGSFIAFPVFWYLYIWRRGQPNDSQPL